MKKLLSIMLCACICTTVTACTANNSSETESVESENSSSTNSSNASSESNENNGSSRSETVSSDSSQSGSSSSDRTPDTSVSSSTTAEPTPAEPTAESKILVAYFSLAGEQYEVGVIEKGNTEIVAEMIAEATGADVFKIESTTEYPTTYDGLLDISRKEETNPPQIAETVDNMTDYDTIFLGYPIWWGDTPTIIKVFLQSYDFSGKTIVPFCTHGGSGLSGTGRTISELCPNSTIKDGLAIRGSTAQNDRDSAKQSVTKWLEDNGYGM